MADVHKLVKLTLDESRLLVLGAQILLGFQYRAFLEPGFRRLPPLSQQLRIVSLGLMLLSILLLMWPIGMHQIAEAGHLTRRLLRFATSVMEVALLPFALALGIDIYTVTQQLAGYRFAFATGLASALLALLFWYGLEYGQRLLGRKEKREMSSDQSPPSTLDEKIDTILTECRVVIPGTQALLGFQLIAVLMDGFERLPRSSQYTHLASLLLMTLSAILLMAPAAYHRIVERGEDTERLWRFSRAMLLAAMAVLATGIAAESFVVARQVTGDLTGAICFATGIFIAFITMWFGFTTYMRVVHGPGESKSDRRRKTSSVSLG